MRENHEMVTMNRENTLSKVVLEVNDINEKSAGNLIFSGETVNPFPIRMGVRETGDQEWEVQTSSYKINESQVWNTR